jgi:AcrR family transcriptional regulator
VARKKSDHKRNRILDAAVAVFAERGAWSTPTSAISKAAGVAEGTLFTYFATKETLMNELYRAIKLELADALLASFPTDAAVQTRLQHLWDHYVQWGVRNPRKLKVLEQLQVSDQITAESRAFGYAPFAEIERIGADLVAGKDEDRYPFTFLAALFMGMAETTIASIAADRASASDYRRMGFEIFWRGISS